MLYAEGQAFCMIIAYIDPGTGSYLFQIVIAALIGIGVTTKAYWAKISSFFVKIFKH